MTDAILDVRNISKSFGALKASNDICLTLVPGEIHALIGPNGAGKSTLIKQIAGGLKADSGEVWFDGEDVTHKTTVARARIGLGRTFQVSSLAMDYTVAQNMVLGALGRRGKTGLKGFFLPAMKDRALLDVAHDALSQVGLEEFANTITSELSHGQRRQLEVAVALTLSPIMSAYASPEGGHEGPVTRWINERFDQLHRVYGRCLDHVFQWRPQVLFGGVFFTLLIVPFFLFSQKELAPIEDQGQINIIIEAPPEASLDYTTDYMQDVVSAMLATPDAKFMWQILRPNAGFGGVKFGDFKDRDQSVQEKIPQVYAASSAISGLKVFPVLSPALPTAGRFDVELVVQSPESPEKMKQYADKMIGEAYASGRFLFVDTDLKIDQPQVRLILDRQRIADLGMDLTGVSQQLGVLLSGNYVNRFDLGGKAYRVIPMLKEQSRQNPEAVLDLQLRTPKGDLIPVSSVATLEHSTVPRVLGKFQQKNAFRIYGGVLPGTTKEQGLSQLEAAAAKHLPASYTLDYAGESRQLRQEGSTLVGVLGIALIFVYLVLAVQFNSFRDPLVVLIGSVPLALAGAMLFPFLGWTTINIYSQIGFITLVGLIAKNGILIVEFANHLQTEGFNKLAAIKGAAETRLRPVLMTTAATALGHFPLVLVTGAGAEARNSIGIVLVAGMVIGTFFTLFVLPCVYLVLAERHGEEGVDPEHFADEESVVSCVA